MIIQASRELLTEKAAVILYKTIQIFIKTKNRVVMAVPGGRSVAGIFDNLRECDVPWEQVHIFLLDERLVPAGHPESNYRLVKEHLGRNCETPYIYPFRFDPMDLKPSVSTYYKELQSVGGVFDIVLASCGEDGHVASLFPNHHSVENKERGFVLMNDAPKPPQARMSASYELIRQADTGMLLFFGDKKINALKNFFNIHLSDIECPAKVMTKLHRYYLLTDLEVQTP